MTKKKIFIVTERRADYSRFKPILELIKEDKDLAYHLVVTGVHLSKRFGYTFNEIINSPFRVYAKFNMFEYSVTAYGPLSNRPINLHP